MSPLRSSAGPGGLHERDVELVGDDLRQRRLAQAGRPGEQDVVERLAARGGGRDRDRELLLQRLLADELVEPLRAQRAVELVLGAPCGVWMRSAPGVRIIGGPPSARGRSGPRACRPSAPSSSCSASCGGEPSPTRPSRASARGSSPRRDDDRVVGGRRADLLAQLDDDPLGRALADARHGLQARGVAGGERAEQLARRAAAEHGERHLRADGLDADAAAGTGRAPPRWRSRRAAARRRARSGGCAASPACRPRARGAASRPRRRAGSRRRRTATTTWSGRRTATSPATSAIMPPRAPPAAARGWRGRWRRRARRPRGRAAAARAAPAASGPSAGPGSLPARPVPQTAPLTCWGV